MITFAFTVFQMWPWTDGLQKAFAIAKVSGKASHSLSYLPGFHITRLLSGITDQQMLILNTLASLPLCQGFNTKWGLLCLFNHSQNRTTARKKHKFAEGGSCVCDSEREITPKTPTVFYQGSWNCSGTVNFGYHASDSWINSSVNKYRISSVIHSDLQFDSACKWRSEFSSIL